MIGCAVMHKMREPLKALWHLRGFVNLCTIALFLASIKMSAGLYTFLAALLTIGIGWCWSYVKPRPADDHQPPKTAPTFCVRGVPLDWKSDDLRSLLARKHDSAAPDVRSLAVEVHGRSQTATVSFRNVPHELQMLRVGQPWEIPLPAMSDNRSPIITLDRDFLGVATLYAPPPQDHKVEYVSHLAFNHVIDPL